MPRPLRKLPDKICPICGRSFNRKKFGSGWEDAKRYQSRKTCSQSCGNSLLNPSTQAYRLRAQKHKKRCCETCGTTIDLDAHHVDGNIKNNTSENVRTLCHPCHMKSHLKQRNWLKNTRSRGLIGSRPSATPSSRKSPTKSSRESQKLKGKSSPSARAEDNPT